MVQDIIDANIIVKILMFMFASVILINIIAALANFVLWTYARLKKL